MGQLAYIGQIRLTGDGGFVATARTSALWTVRVHCPAEPGKLTEIWRSKQLRERADFNPEAMLGVDTDFIMKSVPVRVIPAPEVEPGAFALTTSERVLSARDENLR